MNNIRALLKYAAKLNGTIINLVTELEYIEYSFSGNWVYFYSPQDEIIAKYVLDFNEKLLQTGYIAVGDEFYNIDTAPNIIICVGFTDLLYEPKHPENKFIITESIRQMYARIHTQLNIYNQQSIQ